MDLELALCSNLSPVTFLSIQFLLIGVIQESNLDHLLKKVLDSSKMLSMVQKLIKSFYYVLCNEIQENID